MSQQKTDNRLARREFLSWLCKIGGGVSVVTLAADLLPLKRINKTFFSSEAHAAVPCTEDMCTTRDVCVSGDAVHTCQQSDVCNIDESGDCTNDECNTDASGECQTDTCVTDESGDCTNDECTTDASGTCQTDNCGTDESAGCTNDECNADASGYCQTDTCGTDESGGCTNDECDEDKSGNCTNDECTSDQSGYCYENDVCTTDKSGECYERDACNSDHSGVCSLMDVCVLDASSHCASDLCRDDKTPGGFECTTSDTCALDLALDSLTNRRQFARAGINKAMKLLYRLAVVVLFIGSAYGQSDAGTVIDATNAVFSHNPTYVTSGSVTVTSPVGPFLRDCDNDGILEADVNGDGQCAGDPEVKDYNGDGTRELPGGTSFTGDFEFTCFHIPDDVAIVATGPLTIKASREVAVFGAVRLSSGAGISCQRVIDLRTSAWLSEDGSTITLTTVKTGDVDETQAATYAYDDDVPSIDYTSICEQCSNLSSILMLLLF